MGLFDRLKKAFQKDKEEPKVVEEDKAVEEPIEDTNTKNSHDASAEASAEPVTEEVEETVVETEDSTNEGAESTTEEETEDEAAEPVVETIEEVVVEDESQSSDNTEGSATEEQTAEVIEESVVDDHEEEENQPAIKVAEVDETTTEERYDKGLEKTRKTFGQRMNELFANFRRVDENFFEDLEDTLITSDVGFETAMKLTDELREEVKLQNVKKAKDIQNVIIEKLVNLYDEQGKDEDNALHLKKEGLSIILFVGVNGAGKTTTIGKLAHQLKAQGKKVILAAADTFRAGAINQLVTWGERSNIEVVRGKEGGDPASVVFDALQRAQAEQADVLLVDTAGRLQNKVNLMNELEKIKRIIQREEPDAPQEVLLVLDATTGQNAMSQAKQFKETTDVTGLVLTKLDGTAKGGMILAIRNELHLPVKLVGLGEGINDLATFDPEQFAYGLFKGLWSE